MKLAIASIAAALILTGCNNTTQDANTTTEQVAVPSAPTISYEQLLVSDEAVGPFTLSPMEDSMGTAINYQARSGVLNVFELVADDVTTTGYVKVEKGYSFGDKYVLVVSTGESGLSCPATTYAFVFDTKSESVSGKTTVDGCSEAVDSLADGNKLTVKKEGTPTIIFNAEITAGQH